MRARLPVPHSPPTFYRNFIRLLWISFLVEEKTFSKYSYLPLLVIITILQLQLFILLANVLLKKYQKYFIHTIRESRDIVNLKAYLWKIYAVAYPWPIRLRRFLRSKNRSTSWGMGFWDKALERMFHIYIQKVYETSEKFFKIITSSLKMFVKHKIQKRRIKRTDYASSK